MAVFGAPVALEDHAIRACLGRWAFRRRRSGLPWKSRERDGVDLQVRVGLNSGRVIAGEIGSGALGYAAIGEQVGDGAAHGVGRTAGRRDAERVHGATG